MTSWWLDKRMDWEGSEVAGNSAAVRRGRGAARARTNRRYAVGADRRRGEGSPAEVWWLADGRCGGRARAARP